MDKNLVNLSMYGTNYSPCKEREFLQNLVSLSMYGTNYNPCKEREFLQNSVNLWHKLFNKIKMRLKNATMFR